MATDTDEAELPPGVVLVPGHDPEVVAWWSANYAGVVASAGRGAPLALHKTMARARRELEYARLHGVPPAVGVPDH